MEDVRKHCLILIVILLINSTLLLLKFLPNVIVWDTSSENFLFDILGILWPIMGITAAIEFILGDKWGWGGILFHLFILYCSIYYLFLTIIAIFNFLFQIGFILAFLLELAISIIGWFGFLYYYD